jgi:hypothetical protein
MYYDDPYDPNLKNDYEPVTYNTNYVEDFDTDTETATVTSRVLKNRKLIEESKMKDKGYCKIERLGIYTNKPHSMVNVEIYSGYDNPGMPIRDAITGNRYHKYKVGTRDENLFFKVGLVTGEKGLRENRLFFFDTPEQYERHMHCVLDAKIKNDWLDKNLEEMAIRKEKK